MRTLQDHLILYDAECPLCQVSTRAFVKAGMLDGNGRADYQHMPEVACPVVNRQRAVNEIALVNTQTGEVTYGINSLFKIFGNSFPFLRSLFNNRVFLWFMTKVYAFISYNRRVIMPAANQQAHALQPSFRLNYRLAYLAFTWLAVGCILTAYAHLLAPMVPAGNAYREYLICGGQILFQGLVISLAAPHKRWDYLGNMMTISFGGALLLLPGLLVTVLIQLPALVYIMYFMAVAGLMLLAHIRRSRLLGLGWALTISWVIYRLAVLSFIYLIN
jgi:predicted DCC family thiol-disulfide oxidoreductase YuxK